MNITSPSSFLPQSRTLSFEPRVPPEPMTEEQMKAKYRAEHPLLTPQQALASNAELGPPTGSGRADNQASKIHTEIKVNGKVIARTYNSGAVEIANEYGFLSEELGFNADTLVGPDAAADRAARINAALERYGAVTKDSLSPAELTSATLAKKPILESLLSDTAQTQQEWLNAMMDDDRREPGSLFSRQV